MGTSRRIDSFATRCGDDRCLEVTTHLSTHPAHTYHYRRYSRHLCFTAYCDRGLTPAVADRCATIERRNPIRWLDGPLHDDTHLPHITAL